MEYIALKLDMIRSRKLSKRDLVQKQFLSTATEINKKFNGVLEAEFIVTHGDEAQALLKKSNAHMTMRIFEFLSISMKETHFRCGIGLGTLSTSVQKRAIGMDGIAWQNAKEAIQCAKKERQVIHFKGFGPLMQTHLNALGNLLCYLQMRWTKEQIEAIRLLTQFSTQKEIAACLGISEAAVSKRLAVAGWQHYYAGRQSLELLLKQVAETENNIITSPWSK